MASSIGLAVVILIGRALIAMGAAPVPTYAAQGSIAIDQAVEHGGVCRKSLPAWAVLSYR
ncbi:hypothetical protein TH5_17320 [Thalassospira xianhensis MCCC 1A02616]|uniref:Uncharacterized protein n=1 Tax=Thalassospira xianhensis MCCC 1A02616 TaxID=1177929 RepID=A0A367UC33_9PROT|nr:hypothetical protein TH5_17320 [Thalassospira xianhensis MCCC 1A02616]